MKTLNYILGSVLLLAGLSSCTNEWDSHYGQHEVVINNVDVKIVDEPASAFLQNETSYSSMYELFKSTGVLNTLEEKGLLYTIMVVNNEKATRASSATTDDENTFLAKSHITDVSISPSNLKDGQRLLMWNSKYVNVTTQNATTGEAEIAFNGSKVKRVIKTDNAYIYELEDYINTPKSLMEVVEGLGDDYSIFKEMVLSRTMKTFDKKSSTPIGIDKTGNTVYDSVFTVKSPYFEKKKMDLYSESMHATMFIPSNELVTKALEDARNKLKSWNMEREDSILTNWIFQSAFYTTEYKKEDFGNEDKPDLTSIFGHQWRTTVNKVDLNNPIEMSNGTAYYVTSLKIPTNKVLIWRIKDLLSTYNDLTESERADNYLGYRVDGKSIYFGENFGFTRVKNYVTYQPNPTWPVIKNDAMMLWLVDGNKKGVFHFKCYKLEKHVDGTHTVTPYTLPPGEYGWYIGVYGSRSNVNASFYLNDQLIGSLPASTMKGLNFDRGGGGYNELYTTDAKYDRDGTLVGIFTITGDKPMELNARIEITKSGQTTFEPASWCFRPTDNCY